MTVEHRRIETNGIRLHCAVAGDGPLVILLHGFPECWYSWRHQLTALADAGYHAVAPDQRSRNWSATSSRHTPPITRARPGSQRGSTDTLATLAGHRPAQGPHRAGRIL